MNTNNDNLSDKEKLLDTNTKTVQKQNQWTIYDLENDIDSVDKSPYSSTESFVPTLNNQNESLTYNDNNDSGTLYRDNILSETGSSTFSSSTRRRGSFILSDSESHMSLTSLAPSRRRALSTASRSKGRFSMHELGSSKISDNLANSRFLSRHSMAFDNGFNINNGTIRNSLEDRERIGNAGKGFGNLINDEGEKESIADLIAGVKDEDAVKLALITQKHAGQKNRILNNTETDLTNIEKNNAENLNFGFHPSETTLSNSRTCKQFLENKYHVLFKIINNNGVYNPLPIVKNRKNDMAREGSDHSLGSSDKFSGGNSNRLTSSRMKSRGSLPRRKESSIWDVSHMEIFKDYEQRNKFDQVRPGKQIGNEIFDDKVYKMESEPNDTKKRLKYHKLSQMFIPPTTQEIQTMSSLEERGAKGSNGGESKGAKHSSLNNITTTPQGKEDSHSKSKKWSIHLFKRKDKKHKNESSLPDIGTIQISDYLLASQTNAKSVSDLSSGDQSPRSSVEDVRFSSEKDNDSLQINSEDIMHNNESGIKCEKDVPKVPEEKHNHNRVPDDLTDDASSRRNSMDTSISHSNNSSARNSVDLGSDVPSRQNTARSLNIEERSSKFRYEQHEDNRSSENKTAEYSTESDDEYEDETVNERVGETVLVNLDVFPQELVKLVAAYQEQGIVDRNIDNGNVVELDIGLNENFKFHKLIGYGVDILDLQISLVYDNAEDTRSLNQQDADEIIKRYDECIEEATESLGANEIFLADCEKIIKNNDYISNETHVFESLDIPFVISPISMNSSDILADPFDNINQQNYLPSRPIVVECKLNIEKGIQLLNNKLFNIEDIVNKLERQHASISEEMNIMLDEIENMAKDVNNDYLHELKILEDEIHLLIAERGKLLDIFYWIMSYVLAGVMFMFWFIVACFNMFKKILLLPRKMWK